VQASPRAGGWRVAALFVLSAAAVIAPAVPAAAQTGPSLILDPVCTSPDGHRWFEVINDGDTAVAWEAVGVDNPAHRRGTVGPHDIEWFWVHLPGEQTTIQLWAGGIPVDEKRASDVDCSDPSHGYGPGPPYEHDSTPAPTPTADPTPPSTPTPDPVPPTASPTPQRPPASAPPATAAPAPTGPAPAVPPVPALPPAAEAPHHHHTPHATGTDAPPPSPAGAATPPPDPGPQPSDELVVPVLPDEPLLPTATPQPVVVAPEDGDARIPGWMVQAAAATVVGMRLVLVLVRNPADLDGPAAAPHPAARRGPGGRPSPGAAACGRRAPSPDTARSPGAPPFPGTSPAPGGAPPWRPAPPAPEGARRPVDPRRPPVDGGRGSAPRQPGARPLEVGAPRQPRRLGAPPALPERRTGDWSAWERSEEDGG